MEEAKALELFKAWFVRPLEVLDINGGFIAFMVALALFERMVIAKLKLTGIPANKQTIKRKMSEELGLTEDEQSVFWNMFRDGLLHEGMPKVGRTGFIFHSTFSERPEFGEYDGKPVICIDPWKFTDRILREYESNPRLITASDSFPLALVDEIQVEKLRILGESK
jgi:hypothetical protein